MQALMKSHHLGTEALSAQIQARPVVLTDLDVQSLDSERIEIRLALMVMRPRPVATRSMIRSWYCGRSRSDRQCVR